MEDIAKLQADVEKAQEGRNTILSWFGKGDLAKAKKELSDKDEEIAGLNKRLKELQAEKARLQERHKLEIGKLRDGYQKEIEAAIRKVEAAERQSKEKDTVIERQQKQIDLLDRKANPHRYSLSSGAELVRISVPNHRNPSLHIWTRVGEELYEDTKFQINYCSVFGEVKTKTINKKGSNITDEEIKITTYNCKDGISFTTVIQDESSKATPAELALPLVYGKKNIVIGDHRQLPPMLDKDEFKNTLDFLLDNASGESELRQLKKLKSYVIKNFDEMEISHFQRIYENIDPSLKGKFTHQYRMHPDINEVIKQFYENKENPESKDGLVCGLIDPVDLGVNDTNMSNPFSRYHGIQIDDFICGESLSPENHVVWIDVNSPEMIEGTSRVNEGEVKVISHILEKMSLSDSFKEYCNKWTDEDNKEIGIISFYSKQKNRIRKMSRSFNNLPMKIDVVDRFQGMERNIIIVSMVRSNTISDSQQEPDFTEYELGYPEQTDLGFAQSPNRLNVALSRAKRLLIIIGNSELFRQKDIYDNVYKIIAANPNGKIIKCNPYEDLRK